MEEEIAAIEKTVDTVVAFVVDYGFQVLGAVVVLVLGALAARWAGAATVRFCRRRNLDAVLTKFAGGAARTTVLAFAVLVAMGKFGISLAPFVAAIGALAFGTSFALQGPLSNYAAGLVLVLTRPFTVGDTIRVNEAAGQVEDLSLSSTVLVTEDGERVTIPNKHVVGEVLTNSFANRIAEASIGISYGDDPREAVEVVRRALAGVPGIVEDPAPQVGILEFADSAVTLGMRYWVPTRRYFPTLYEANLAVYTALKEAGITIPFPQRDVRVVSDVATAG